MVDSMWTVLSDWFTPTVLFCLLNLTIGTIYISSNLKSHNNKPPHPNNHGDHHHPNDWYDPPQALFRTPSLLERVKSINFSLHRYGSAYPGQPETHEPDPNSGSSSEYEKKAYVHPQLVRAPSILERVKSINFSLRSQNAHPAQPETQVADQTPIEQVSDHHVYRTQSDVSGEGPARVPATMKKSASEKFENPSLEEIDRLRPATMREGKASFGEDEEVDAKADDFINKFRQQLKLQRLDSFVRFKEMLNRGSAK